MNKFYQWRNKQIKAVRRQMPRMVDHHLGRVLKDLNSSWAQEGYYGKYWEWMPKERRPVGLAPFHRRFVRISIIGNPFHCSTRHWGNVFSHMFWMD